MAVIWALLLPQLSNMLCLTGVYGVWSASNAPGNLHKAAKIDRHDFRGLDRRLGDFAFFLDFFGVNKCSGGVNTHLGWSQ